MRRSASRKTRSDLPLDDTLVLLCWLLVLIGAFGFTCWLCYRLLQLAPFVVIPPPSVGS